MFAKTFESVPLPYRLPSEFSAELFPLLHYNDYLITPPRIYGETLPVSAVNVFVTKERTQYSDVTIHLMATLDIIYWPSYEQAHFRFDAMSGRFLGRDELSLGLAQYQLNQARDGGIWVAVSPPAAEFHEVEGLTYTTISGTSEAAAKYGASSVDYALVDKSQNLVVMKTNLETATQLGVYNFTSGALIRRINIAGAPMQIFAEDAKRCYVLSSNYMLTLFDYTSGEVISVLRAPGLEVGAIAYRYTWDRFLRRLLVFVQRSDATDGASRSTFCGYYPVPLAVGMTPPIPVRAPRAGRTMQFVSRVYGDAGEGIPGVKVTPAAGAGDVIGAPPFTDSDGEAIISVQAPTGSVTLSATADI